MTLFHHLVNPHFSISALPVPEYSPYNPPQTRLLPPVPPYSNAGPDYPTSDPDPAKADDVHDRIQGIDLLAYMREPANSKEFPQLQHQFISVLAALSYGVPAEEAEREPSFDLTAIQGESGCLCSSSEFIADRECQAGEIRKEQILLSR